METRYSRRVPLIYYGSPLVQIPRGYSKGEQYGRRDRLVDVSGAEAFTEEMVST